MPEVKAILEPEKDDNRITRLPVPLNKVSRKLLTVLQGDYQSKYGKKIHRADLAGIILGKALKNATI